MCGTIVYQCFLQAAAERVKGLRVLTLKLKFNRRLIFQDSPSLNTHIGHTIHGTFHDTWIRSLTPSARLGRSLNPYLNTIPSILSVLDVNGGEVKQHGMLGSE
jgi:hypothetical protein